MRTFQQYIVAVFVLIFLVACGDKKKDSETIEEKKPNIIYVLADDLGYGDIGAFNSDGKIKTPNIDQLAKDGMSFTDAHSPSAVCTPTRYGILTGRYSWRSPLKQGVLTGKSKALIPDLKPEVILIDPMHPPRGNSALVKLEMRQIRDIVGADTDAVDLINLALQHARNRVVLKWPRKAESPVGARRFSHQILGKSTRYDVFMTPSTKEKPDET